MKNGDMFGNLDKYRQQEYEVNHNIIKLTTLYEEREYEIMAVCLSQVFLKTQTDVFKYYKFIDATSENEFESNMNEMAQMSLYDTGIKAKYGDKLITLSTCDSSEANGRFVVVAKKKK